MFARAMVIVSLLPAVLGGCAAIDAPSINSDAGFGETTIVADAPPPVVHSSGTAVAGWASNIVRDDPATSVIAFDQDDGSPYKLDSGDKLRVFVYAQPSLSRLYTIDSEGFISVPLIGNVMARGKTTRNLEGAIKGRLGAQFVRDPHVTVDIQQHRPFFILGEVKAAGQYPYVGGLTVDAAVAIAGGYSERANERKVQITRRIKDGMEKLEVPGDTEVRAGDTIYVKERWF